MAPVGGRTYVYEASAIIGIWAFRRGTQTWQKVTTETVSIYGSSYNSGGTRTFSWYMDGTYQLGGDVQAVGLSIDSTTGNSAAIAAFTNLMWQAQGQAAGTRSATPNGQKSIITIRPQ